MGCSTAHLARQAASKDVPARLQAGSCGSNFKAATRELITFSEHFALGAAADFGIIELRWSAGQYSGARLSAEPGRGARAKALRPWAATAQHADSQ